MPRACWCILDKIHETLQAGYQARASVMSDPTKGEQNPGGILPALSSPLPLAIIPSKCPTSCGVGMGEARGRGSSPSGGGVGLLSGQGPTGLGAVLGRVGRSTLPLQASSPTRVPVGSPGLRPLGSSRAHQALPSSSPAWSTRCPR